jgi:CheY-like chemotaxis protein
VSTPAPEIEPPLIGGTETILLAEDEEALRNLARVVLEELGYRVLVAKDGEEAVALYVAERERIDLLLLDVVMPRLGGSESYERIRELGGDVPLILMTGYSSETVQSRFVKQSKWIEESGTIVIQKPYSIEALGRRVREVLDKANRK